MSFLFKNENLINLSVYNTGLFGLNHFINNSYRLLTSALCFGSTPQWFIGSILLYQYRIFERLLGSRKYCSFMFYSYLFHMICQVGLIAVLPLVLGSTTSSGSTTASYHPIAGPYFLLFSLLPLYYSYIPRINTFPVLGSKMSNFNIFNISEKSIVYFLLIQLVMSYTNSISTSGSGMSISNTSTSSIVMNTTLHIVCNTVPSLCFGYIFMMSNRIQALCRFPKYIEVFGTRCYHWLNGFIPLTGGSGTGGGGGIHTPLRPGNTRGVGQPMGQRQGQRQGVGVGQSDDELLRAAMNASMNEYNHTNNNTSDGTNNGNGGDTNNTSSDSGSDAQTIPEESIEMLMVSGIMKYIYIYV